MAEFQVVFLLRKGLRSPVLNGSSSSVRSDSNDVENENRLWDVVQEHPTSMVTFSFLLGPARIQISLSSFCGSRN